MIMPIHQYTQLPYIVVVPVDTKFVVDRYLSRHDIGIQGLGVTYKNKI
jgi:hypothetical protein